MGEERKVNLCVILKNLKGDILDKRIFKNIELKNGHDIKPLEEFRFKKVNDGIYAIIYEISDSK